MEYKYTITPTIFSRAYKFAELHAKIYSLFRNPKWEKQLSKLNTYRTALTSIATDKNMLNSFDNKEFILNIEKELEGERLEDFTNYLNTLHEMFKIFPDPENLTWNDLHDIHRRVIGLHSFGKHNLRKNKRILPKKVWENDVAKTIEFEVKTKPSQITKKISDFFKWIKENYKSTNTILLAGITHFAIADIHPYDDGNGRLSRIVAKAILYRKGVDPNNLIVIDDFYLRNQERYYDVLDHAISSEDITEWLEFYTEGLLFSVNQTIRQIYEISGSTIDINSNKFIPLTVREADVLEVVKELFQASGAQIAKQLKVSRQNINNILKHLHSKGILRKIGQSTSSRYEINY
jgi:Fic family protein